MSVDPVYPGAQVTLRSALGVIRRTVVRVREGGDVLEVTRYREVRQARNEGRAPRTVGFQRRDLIPDPPAELR